MDDMKDALGTTADMTVFRKLRGLDYLTSYSHRGQYYVLRSGAQFDKRGLWSHRNVHFSQFGSLLDTAAEIVSRSEKGYFSPELAKELLVPVKDALRLLVERNRLVREALGRLHLYLSSDPAPRRQQRLAREAALAMASAAEAASDEPGVEGHEARAAILLFYSLLDEQQRRLFAGLESLRVGRGGDRRIAELLGLDVHTVGRGRKDLANWDLQLDRVRRPGAGRPPLEKKRPK